MREWLEAFHFLRPWWLLGLAAAAVMFLWVQRRESTERRWRGIIAPALLEHLMVKGGAVAWFRPVHLVTACVAIGSVAAAGPTWRQESTPFSEDLAPLVIAIDLSRSMDAIDVAPSRLERAKQKVRDLLAERRGARTAVLVYAGTAHPVLPFTDDPALLETYVTALDTRIMPVAGKEPTAALQVAESMLERDTVPGTILFLTDGIAREHAPAFADHAERTRDAVAVLAFGTREGGPIPMGENRFLTESGRRVMATLDVEGLEALRSEAGIDVTSATVDDADVQRIQRRVQSHLASVRAEEDESARWIDFGYWLVLPVTLLCLLWFRRGWTVQWAALFLASALGGLTGCGGPVVGQEAEPELSEVVVAENEAPPAASGGFRFIDLWLTADQQGWRLYEQGEYAGAAELFEDPAWKGAALYRAGAYDEALDWFARVPGADGAFNMGNALARSGAYEDAIASYDEALAERPDWTEALENRALVESLIPPEEPPPDGAPPGTDPTFEADQVEFDDKADQGSEGEVEMQTLSDEQVAEMWLRGLTTSPADFLRVKFAIQVWEADE